MKNVKIMFIDDDKLISEVVYEFFNNLYDIKVYVDPFEALNELKKSYYDILIADYRMPGIDGIELFKEAKKNSLYSYGILFSAYTTPEMEKEAIEKDLVSVIVGKPFKFDKFQTVIDRAIEKVKNNRFN